MTTVMPNFTTREVYAAAENGSFEFCHWDISRIPGYDYEGFFGGLPNVVYKKVQRVRFSIDLWHTINTYKRPVSDSDRWVCSESIATQIHRYPRRLIKILLKTAPLTKQLKSLEIQALPLTRDDIGQLMRVLPSSPTLESLVLSQMQISNASVSEFLSAGAPYRLREIRCSDCQLGPQVATAAVEFIETAPRSSAGRPWVLKTLDLSNNDIDPAAQAQIDRALSGKMVEERVADVQEEEGDFAEPRREESIAAGRELQARVAAVKPAVATEDPFEENGNLRGELAQLLAAVQAVAVRDDVYLIGPSAADVASMIALCEKKVNEPIPAE
jgi:hypothetical protein